MVLNKLKILIIFEKKKTLNSYVRVNDNVVAKTRSSFVWAEQTKLLLLRTGPSTGPENSVRHAIRVNRGLQYTVPTQSAF